MSENESLIKELEGYAARGGSVAHELCREAAIALKARMIPPPSATLAHQDFQELAVFRTLPDDAFKEMSDDMRLHSMAHQLVEEILKKKLANIQVEKMPMNKSVMLRVAILVGNANAKPVEKLPDINHYLQQQQLAQQIYGGSGSPLGGGQYQGIPNYGGTGVGIDVQKGWPEVKF